MIYAWLTGHVRNLGDSALRRAYAGALRERGPIRVWSGAPGSGYEAGLGLEEGESSSSFWSWYWLFALDTLRSRPVFAFNAGAFGVTKAYFAGLVALFPWLLILKGKGGRILWVGAAVSDRRGLLSVPFDLLAAMSRPLVWRDTESCRLMGRGGSAPDWAFGLYPGGAWLPGAAIPTPDSERRYLAVWLRGDRPYPTRGWIDSVADLARRLGLVLVFVAQVQDDDALNRRLARELGGEYVGWQHADHLVQERLARQWYGRSIAILSDRLHALVVAATEGAVPLGWTDRPSRKIRVHMDLVGASWASVCPSQNVHELLAGLDGPALAALREETAALMAAARSQVHALGWRLLEDGDSWPADR